MYSVLANVDKTRGCSPRGRGPIIDYPVTPLQSRLIEYCKYLILNYYFYW